MRERKKGRTQEQAAAKANLKSRKTAARYEQLGLLPSQLKRPRTYRTRPDAFVQDWPQVEQMLSDAPELEAKALFEWLQEKNPGKYQEKQLRTFHRRVARWRALWPACSHPERDALEQLIALIRSHGAAFAASRPDQGWQQRIALRARLRRLFRRSTMQPVALFAYLALVAMDLERLRGTLVNRVTFAGESLQ